MAKSIVRTKQDQVYIEAIERFRIACNWTRSELIRNIAELAEQICDDDKDIYIARMMEKKAKIM